MTTTTPMAPSLLPGELQAKWQKVYEQAFKQAQTDYPDDSTAQKQAALREANRMLRVTEPTSYAEAKALADWQCLSRKEVDGKLLVVTIDAKKYSFNVPAGGAQPLEKMKKEELIAYAKEAGIEIAASATKDEILAAIEASGK